MRHILGHLRNACIALLLAPLVAFANGLPTPTGEVLLSIDGAITVTNDGDRAIFDRDMLGALGPVTVETTTIWTEGVQTFTGVPLVRLMAAVGATGDSLTARAINDYAISIPSEDWIEDGPIVAYLNNGAVMPLREKGPLWIVYPYDSAPRFQTEVTFSRSIWQLDRLTVDN